MFALKTRAERRTVAAALFCACLVPAACADEVGALVARIKAVRGEGAGNVAASRASKELSRHGPASLIAVLQAMDDADPIAANWLRGAVDAIAERAMRDGRPLPAAEFESFVLDRSHAGPVRRLASEWLVRTDATAPDRLIPGMLDDPSTELRRDAVARELERAQQPVPEIRQAPMLHQNGWVKLSSSAG
jgi:hypothetical protein